MKEKIKAFGMIILGNLLLAFALSTLVIENNIIAGGVTGIGIVFNHFTAVDISVVVAMINVILFAIGFLFVGKAFVMKTLISSIVFPIFLNFFENTAALHHYCTDPLLASVLGGSIMGIGVGLVLKAGASTGGLDVISVILNNKFKIPVFITLNLFDLMVLSSQISFSDTMKILYGIVVIIMTTYMVDKTLTSGKNMVQVSIISDQYEEIKQVILKQIDAGVTLLHSENGYSGSQTKMVVSIVSTKKLENLKSVVLQLDQKAFITVSSVHEVSGRGFTQARFD